MEKTGGIVAPKFRLKIKNFDKALPMKNEVTRMFLEQDTAALPYVKQLEDVGFKLKKIKRTKSMCAFDKPLGTNQLLPSIM